MLDILSKYAISYTSLVAEQMLGMIKEHFTETRSLPKKSKWKKYIISQDTSQRKCSLLTASLISQT